MESNENVRYINHKLIKKFGVDLFEREGVPTNDAQIIVDNLVKANLRGVDSHGVSRIPIYMKRLKLKLVEPVCKIKFEKKVGSVAVINGCNSMGAVVGYNAMKYAINAAREKGIFFIAVNNSNHFGTAAFYSMMALDYDMIGFATSNAPSTMAPWGGIKPFIGTNPFSFAIPAGKRMPIVIDMATSVVARGKIILAEKNNQRIPEGWAINKEGEVTTDAKEALEGSVLPFGGPKGYAISLLIDILCGILSGAAYGPYIGNLYENFVEAQNVGHCFAAIDISKFIDVEVFKYRIDKMIEEIKDSPKAKNVEEIYLPGEIEYRTQKERLEKGIPLTLPVIQELKELGRSYNVNTELFD
ncbi:Ldh family oxidoreductase [Thermoanaerobacterium sp. DL9XJH110]|uniref:Ldh family oxidoreductase n=1 Tax=Thermoanaerobacterium sp. DL9XJH110 TaxID=3386643 RepID=UPI003BB61762